MAQAQYDKFIELRKSWVDALIARKQAYWDIPTAPTPRVENKANTYIHERPNSTVTPSKSSDIINLGREFDIDNYEKF